MLPFIDSPVGQPSRDVAVQVQADEKFFKAAGIGHALVLPGL